jgi:hypothetical protein
MVDEKPELLEEGKEAASQGDALTKKRRGDDRPRGAESKDDVDEDEEEEGGGNGSGTWERADAETLSKRR